MLEHRDSALSVPLFVADAGDEAMAEWKCWSRVLGVPLLVDDGEGALREPFQKLGQIEVGTALGAQEAPRRDPLAQALDPDAAETRPAGRRSDRASRRARDHRAGINPIPYSNDSFA